MYLDESGKRRIFSCKAQAQDAYREYTARIVSFPEWDDRHPKFTMTYDKEKSQYKIADKEGDYTVIDEDGVVLKAFMDGHIEYEGGAPEKELERVKGMAATLADLNIAADLIDGVAGDFRDMGETEIADLYTEIWKQVLTTADDLDKKLSASLLNMALDSDKDTKEVA